MMLDSWDGQIWYPRFYDIDTILSYDNSGEIKFDVDIEMEQGYWNTSSSRLWTKVRDLMHDELVETYKDMRANGVTYENIMYYMYDEQIGKIPQTYYNKDFDIKYAPYADQYIGKAHGDGYQHMKRWLKRRFIFCDTLFDYAPSYNNDVLTIRANTLNEMNLTIETYTPLYQHVSFYNGNMEKIKITPGQPATFKGFAQTETDQEVLIYGGSNIKKITGIQSMNPNSMLIGGATRLSELDISNCPILTIVNSNKANFSPHTYLNKLNISNCPQLGGNLNVSNSPLLQEIDARNSAITGLLLPTSLRNLEVMRLPNTIQDLTLYDVPLLHTVELDEGNSLQNLSLSNCSNLTNCINFDLTKVPSISLDNSFDAEELYMSATTNLTLKNMPSLKRVIFTPNSEYSAFDINNVLNGANYKITTFNNPMMTDFITTAPHRYSYGGEYKQFIEASEKVYIVSDMTENHCINYQTGANMDNNSFCRLPYTEVYVGDTIKIESTHVSGNDPSCWVILYDNNKVYKGAFSYNGCYGAYNTTNGEAVVLEDGYMRIRMGDGDTNGKVYHTRQSKIIMTKDITPNTAFTANTLDLADTQFQNVKFLCTTDVYNLKVPTTMKNFYCDSAMDIDTDVIEDASYEVIHEELIEPYTTNYEGEVLKYTDVIYDMLANWDTLPNGQSPTPSVGSTANDLIDTTVENFKTTDYIRVVPGTVVKWRIEGELSDDKLAEYDKDKKFIKSVGNANSNANGNPYVTSVTLSEKTHYIRLSVKKFSTLINKIELSYKEAKTPNIIPSSANGSLIFNMYSNNTTQPTSTSPYMWDLTGLKLEDFYTYGMNNWVKPSDDAYVKIGDTTNLIKARGKAGTGAGSPLDYVYYDNNQKHLWTIGLFKLEPGTYRFRYGDNYELNCTTTISSSIDEGQSSHRQNNQDIFQTTTYVRISFDSSYNSFKINDVVYYVDDIETSIKSGTTHYLWDYYEKVPCVYEVSHDELSDVKSITMPQRMPGYSVRLVNADITPDEYPTMLYPKLIDTTLPITGKLDYTKYNGTSLAWAYAYTTEDVTINPLDSRSQGNITNDYNKLYGTDYVDIVDVWVYKDTDVSKFNTNEAITKAYIELTSANYKTRVDEVLAYYPNCTDLYFFEDGNMNDLSELFIKNTTSRNQIEHITFMEGYFDKVTLMRDCIRVMPNLLTITNLPKNLINMNQAFYGCDKLIALNAEIPNTVTVLAGAFRTCRALNQQIDLSNLTLTDSNGLVNAFYECNALTIPPILPSNYKGSMAGTFYGCTSLTQAPVIPQGVTNMTSTFQGCTSLTTPPVIPQGVTNMSNCFASCTSLTTPAITPEGVTVMGQCYTDCTALTTPPNIPSTCTNIEYICHRCSTLKGNVIIPNSVTNANWAFRRTGINSISIPLDSLTGYGSVIDGCSNVDIIWTGERNNNFNMVNMLGSCVPTQEDIQELVPEHLADITTNIYTIKNRIANINGLEFDLNSHQAYHVGNLIVGTNGSWGGYPNAGCGLIQKAILNGIEIIPILDTSGNPCFLNTSNGSLYYDSMGGTITAGNVIGTYDGYSKLSYIKAENCYVQAEDIEIDINTHDLEYHLLVDASQSATNRHCVNFLGSCGTNIRFYNPAGSFHNTSSNFMTGSATLTLGETYGAYLTPDEIFSANAKGWTIVGASNDFTIVNASVDVSTLTTDESVLSCFIELTNDNRDVRIDEVLNLYPNCGDVYLFDDGSVTDLAGLMYDKNTIANAQIINVTFMQGYFENLKYLNHAFRTAKKLVTVNNIPSTNTLSLYCTFRECSKLNCQLDFSSNTLLATVNNDMYYAFFECKSLTYAPILPNTYNGSMQSTFNGCTSLTTAPDIPSGVTNMIATFNGCTSLTTAPAIPQGVTTMQETFMNCTSLTIAPVIPSSVTNMKYTFRGCSSLTTIDTTNWDTSNVTALDGLFYGCSNLIEIIGIENWNTSKVTGVWDLFFSCGSLTDIDLSKWDMSKMSSTGCMYRYCGSLKTAYLPIQGGIPDNALNGCSSNIDIVWVGERSSDFNIGVCGHANGFREEDIQELVPEHLEDLHKDEIKISFSKKEITINNTKTTWEEE